MRLSEAAAITHGALRGDDRRFHGVAIDSRHIRRGELFVAIVGERRDGHDFIRRADHRGAAAALVSRADREAGPRLAQITVRDTTAALGQLGANWRGRFAQPLVAVTGSNGKTTVSALSAAIFNVDGDCLSPRASFNNQWGVPLTLLRLRARHSHAVIEMGMNRPGEIAYLSGLARPDVALITNVAPAHLCGLADLQGIADAKAEIFSGLAAGGVAVLNADDRFYDYWRGRVGARRALGFGVSRDADVRVAEVALEAAGSEFQLRIGERRTRVRLRIPGAHNVLNAAAAAAAATAAGVGPEPIRAGLESFAALDGRLRPRPGARGALIIDDSYNANPASVKAALEVLAGFPGERIAVLGAMAELGEQSDAYHREVGAHGRRCGIQRLLCLGAEAGGDVDGYVRGFGAGARRFAEMDDLLAHLRPLLAAGVTVLVKGSRAAAMERVVAALTAPAGERAPC